MGVTTSTARAWRRYRVVPIVYRIAAAFVLGSIFGLVVGEPATRLQLLGDLFVRLLSMLIIPIIVFTLLMGVRNLTPSQLGRVGVQVVGLYAVTSAVAVLIGLTVGNLINPGTGLTLTGGEAETAEAPDLVSVLLNIVPKSPLGEMAAGDVLPTIFFVVVFGLTLALLQETAEEESVRRGVETFFDLAEAGAEAMFKLVWGVMEYGVIGVFALMAAVFGEAGVDAIVLFAMLIATVALACAIHIAVVHLGLFVGLLAGQSPVAFLVGVKDVLVTALSIRSSSGTLPVSMTDA